MHLLLKNLKFVLLSPPVSWILSSCFLAKDWERYVFWCAKFSLCYFRLRTWDLHYFFNLFAFNNSLSLTLGMKYSTTRRVAKLLVCKLNGRTPSSYKLFMRPNFNICSHTFIYTYCIVINSVEVTEIYIFFQFQCYKVNLTYRSNFLCPSTWALYLKLWSLCSD